MYRGGESPVGNGDSVQLGIFLEWAKEIKYKNSGESFQPIPTRYGDLNPKDFSIIKLEKWKIEDTL